ncbi:recombinase XerC [Marinosulfonomonas sp. PRT-SC04]|nr:recombinase XerC [Marinosulfonomonas sp. PRT-SC04]
MTSTSQQLEELRSKLIADPDVILEDKDLMRALVAANEAQMGSNIIDLRGIAMERLEARLDRLEDTHRSVIAAAYENLAGTNQVHRAILRMLDPAEFENFLRDLDGEVSEILGVDCVRLVLESVQNENDPAVKRLGDVLIVAEPGFIEGYLTNGKRSTSRQVTLRQIKPDSSEIYGEASDWIRSEAALKLDFGNGRLPGMLVMGSEDPHHFKPNQGTDLLEFFAGVFERAMRRWLS